MESHIFLLQLVVILVAARVCGEIAVKLHIPPVIGELSAGIIIGPSLLGFVEITPSLRLLAEIGIILLLFEVGLETDAERLIKSGLKSSTVAVAGVILPFCLGYALSHYVFDFSLLVSLLIGSTLTATSIGITLRVLKDLNKQNTHETQIILGAAVIDDIIGIVLLAMLYEFATSGSVNFWNAGKVLMLIGIYFLLAPVAVKLISSIIRGWEQKSNIPGLLPAIIVALILFFSWIAHALGAPELLGGFAAGLALSKHFFIPYMKISTASKDFADRIHAQMLPIIHLFTPIFFVSIGLSLNFREIAWNSAFIWALSLSLLAAAIISKLAAGFLLVTEKFFSQLVIGTAMIPRGEVGLIFAGIGLNMGILNEEMYAGMILVIAATTLLPPFVLRLLYIEKD